MKKRKIKPRATIAEFSAEQQRILQNIAIVLVEPEEPANIGGVARAMKNTGLKNLILVKLNGKIPKAAFWVAHASEEILQSAKIFLDFNSAIAEGHLVIGTTQRVRTPYFPMKTADEAIDEAIKVAANQKVMFVFGRESHGLLNHELHQCNLWSRIPSPVAKPAFNLAQAVLIYVYSLYKKLTEASLQQEVELASRQEYEAFYNRLQYLLHKVEFRSKDGMAQFMARVRRVLNSVPMERRDVHVLFTLLDGILLKLKQVEKPGEKSVQQLRQNNT